MIRGENAAIIVQAEEHLKNADSKLRIAHARCHELYCRISDKTVKNKLAQIIGIIESAINALFIPGKIALLRELWSD